MRTAASNQAARTGARGGRIARRASGALTLPPDGEAPRSASQHDRQHRATAEERRERQSPVRGRAPLPHDQQRAKGCREEQSAEEGRGRTQPSRGHDSALACETVLTARKTVLRAGKDLGMTRRGVRFQTPRRPRTPTSLLHEVA